VRKKSAFIGIGGSLLLAALLVSLLMKALRTSLLIKLGVTGANALTAGLVWGLALLGLVFVIIGLCRFIMQQRIKHSALTRQKSALENQQKSLQLDVVRKQIVQVQEERPKLRPDMEKCLEQTGRISDQLKKFDGLIKRSGGQGQALSGARAALEEIERLLCQNFDWVINSALVAGEDGSPTTDKYYDRCRARVQKALEANNKLLDQGNEFLFDLADNISETSTPEGSARIDAWIETIREQNYMFLKGEYASETRN
jgi:hypothetical protein